MNCCLYNLNVNKSVSFHTGYDIIYHLMSYSIWRLSHISQDKMKFDERRNSSYTPEFFENCNECVKGNFKTKRKWWSRSSDLFEIIHTDISRYFPTAAQNSLRYFISFFDDCSRYAYVFLIVGKSSLMFLKFIKQKLHITYKRQLK